MKNFSQKVLILMFILVVFSDGCTQPSINKPTSKSSTNSLLKAPKEWTERKEVYDHWMQAGEVVAVNTANADARRIMDYLRTESGFGIPRWKDGQPSIDTIHFGQTEAEAKRDRSLFMVPLLASDDQLSNYWKDANKKAGYFLAGYKMFVLSGKLISRPEWMGFILLHEGSHALRYKEGKYDTSPDSRCREEIHTWKFTLDLVRAFGGPNYLNLVQQEVSQMEKTAQLPNHFPGEKTDYPQLNLVFGEPISENETVLRSSTFHKDVLFELLKQKFPNNPEMEKKVMCPLISKQ